MNNIIRIAGIALIAGAVSGEAQTARVSLAAPPASRLWIEGTSNVHDWECNATAIDATIDIDAAGLAAPAPKLLKKVSVKIPVSAIKCGHDKMDDNMRKALKADKNAEILFTMASAEAAAEGKEFTLKMTGKLAIAGQENEVTMDVAATRLADGTIKAVASLPVKMTAFGVKPPTAMLGTIRCGDEVKVKFELMVGPRVVAAATEK
jgi:polyisoprenoid-binding protein YceI